MRMTSNIFSDEEDSELEEEEQLRTINTTQLKTKVVTKHRSCSTLTSLLKARHSTQPKENVPVSRNPIHSNFARTLPVGALSLAMRNSSANSQARLSYQTLPTEMPSEPYQMKKKTTLQTYQTARKVQIE